MKQVDEVRLIPISAVAVVSSRARNRQRFMELTESVASVGLKRPITVRKGKAADSYELACGEGRLKAFRALGQKEIPAILVKATSSECLLMGLVENLARGQHSSLELLGEVGRLANAGYTIDQVASKLGFSAGYVRDICYLLKHGEERLLRAIQNKIIPHTTAVEIAKANSGAVRKALLETYLQKPHTSKQIADIRHLIEQRLVNANVSASPRTSSPSGNYVRACIRLQHTTTAAQGGIANEAQDNCSAGDLRRVRFQRVRARARSRTAIQHAQVRRQEPQFQLRRAKATSLDGLTGYATAPRSSRRGWTDPSAGAVMNTIGAAPARAEYRALSWPTWRILVGDRHLRRARRSTPMSASRRSRRAAWDAWQIM
jgi:ParB/RepB/Spo0J family partition protein